MNEYHKIQTVFLRDPETKFKTLLEGQWAEPEFGYLANNEWTFTEKVDGTNIRIMVDSPNRMLRYGGKTDAASIPALLSNRLVERFSPLAEMLYGKFPDGVCLYGEGYGARIQKGGGNYRSDQDFVLFDVKIGHWWLQRKDVEEIAEFCGIGIVPIVGTGTLHNMVDLCRQGVKSAWGDFISEGLVARPSIELKKRNGGRIITKLKTKDFK